MTSPFVFILAFGASATGVAAAGFQTFIAVRQARAAVAELRRLTQDEERQVLQSKDIASDRPQWQRQPLGRLLTTLRQANYIPDQAEKFLRYAISVANSGIHGNEVGVGQAQEAWEAAVRGLTFVSPPISGTDNDG
jgi:hypothetical protein